MHDCRIGMTRTPLVALTALLSLAPVCHAIVGGERADRADFPYFTVVGGGCGGALIAADRVVTAAHCNELVTSRMWVSAGPAKVRRAVVRRAIHPRYLRWQANAIRDNPPGPGDVMLLELARPVEGVPTLALSQASAPAGAMATTIGRGATRPDGSGQGTFRAAEVQVQPDRWCPEQLPSEADEEWSLCTRDPRALDPKAEGPFKSACIGDSGGPLISDGLLVGVVSWGPACGSERDPEIYADVAPAHAFLSDPTPVWAPEPIGRPRIAGRAAAGRVVTCRIRWRVRPARGEYDFIVGGRLVRTGRRPRYRVRAADSGKKLRCTAGGSTAGGRAGTGLSPAVRVA